MHDLQIKDYSILRTFIAARIMSSPVKNAARLRRLSFHSFTLKKLERSIFRNISLNILLAAYFG